MFTNDKKVLVIGDPIIDLTVYSDVVGHSLETPTLKAKQTQPEIVTLGGAGHVVQNLIELHSNTKHICWLSVVGSDRFTDMYLEACRPTSSKLLVLKDRINTVKSRYWIKTPGSIIESSYKYFQLNTVCDKPIPAGWKKDIIYTFEAAAINYDTILIVDYGNGLFDDTMIERIVEYGIQNRKQVICTGQRSNWKRSDTKTHSSFAGASLIVLNEREAYINCKNLNDLPSIFDSNICVTLGDRGSKMYMRNGQEITAEPMIDRTKAVDTCGAGDSFLSCLTLCDWESDPYEAQRIANYWSYLAVQEPGVTVPNKSELMEFLND